MHKSLTGYRHLTITERERLFGLLKQGKSLRYIAHVLSRSHTTLAREVKKNSKYGRAYMPHVAQSRYVRVTKRQRTQGPLKKPSVYLYVREHLRLGWSPELVAGRLHFELPNETITPETIYRYIYQTAKRRRQFVKYLPYSHCKRRKYIGRSVLKTPKIPFAKPIELRPDKVNKRLVVGHWETDLMESSRGCNTALSVTVERTTRYTLLNTVADKKSEAKTASILTSLGVFPKSLCKTITIDNGSENADCKNWHNILGVNVYKCNPYHSWEKGTVENTIGRIRFKIPKGTDLNYLTNNDVQKLQNIMNNTPRKCLNYMTPYEKMLQLQNYKSKTYKPKWCTSK